VDKIIGSGRRSTKLEDKDKNTHSATITKDKVKIIPSTRRGDQGRTSLRSGERVSKSSRRIEVCGNLDESNAALGLAKALTQNELIRSIISSVQRDLIILGAEVSSTDADQQPKRIEQIHISQLENWIGELQKTAPLSGRFVDPGANPVSAALDLARSVIRRTERSMVILQEAGKLNRAESLSYVNRLACLVFSLARYAEKLE
jgi:cob(I)alamin adenosyltransferase